MRKGRTHKDDKRSYRPWRRRQKNVIEMPDSFLAIESKPEPVTDFEVSVPGQGWVKSSSIR